MVSLSTCLETRVGYDKSNMFRRESKILLFCIDFHEGNQSRKEALDNICCIILQLERIKLTQPLVLDFSHCYRYTNKSSFFFLKLSQKSLTSTDKVFFCITIDNFHAIGIRDAYYVHSSVIRQFAKKVQALPVLKKLDLQFTFFKKKGTFADFFVFFIYLFSITKKHYHIKLSKYKANIYFLIYSQNNDANVLTTR